MTPQPWSLGLVMAALHLSRDLQHAPKVAFEALKPEFPYDSGEAAPFLYL